ncbi:MAG: hypothetical protein RIC18_03225 [Hoeflea sp.]|uniref:hypothetical protein n=1 Tax=Hoeflea sp. TaxID=1940281 RepID=UPI0032F03427
MTTADRIPSAALSSLIILQSVMLTALHAGVPPHPPKAIALFGIAPFLAVALSVAVAALILGPGSSRAGRWTGGLAALMALLSFGPQKYFDAQFALIWPAVLCGQAASLILIANLVLQGRASREAAPDGAKS